jgi:hypothetical protein
MVRVREATARRLQARRLVPRETNDEVINRALDALEQSEPPMTDRERIRRKMAGMLVTLDVNRYPPELRPSAGLPEDRDAYFNSLPRLKNPLSRAVREDRDEE